MGKAKEIYMYVLGAFVVGGVFLAAMLLIFYPIPDANKDVVNILIGAFVSAVVTVIAYFFGSSKGSADKTELLNNKGGDNADK